MQDQIFINAYLAGQTVKQASLTIGIPIWKGYELKKKYGLNTERWQKAGMPSIFSSRVREIIFGTLLGDGCLAIAGNCKYHKLSISHCPKQKTYLEWLRQELLELQPSEIAPNSDRWGTLRLYTPPHPELSKIHSKCYPNNKKRITSDWLSELSPVSLAVWYMDDGGTQTGMYGCRIATCSFETTGLENSSAF